MNSAVPHIFSNQRRRLRYERSLARQQRPGAARWLIDAMVEDVLERLAFLRWHGASVLISGLGGDAVAAALEQPAPRSPIGLDRPLAGGPYDLIVSLGELDTVNDLPGALLHLRNALAPGGLLLASIVGAGSLPLMRAAMLAGDGDRVHARVHPQIDLQAASGLLQRARFGRQVVDHYRLTARYRTIERHVADLRDQALTCVLADRSPPLGQAALERARAAFTERADADGKVSEVFEIITITAWNA